MIAVGDRLPETSFFVLKEGRPQKVPSGAIFVGRRIVLFGVPGAFTPTCTLNHLPGFLEHSHAIREKGVDEIAVVAVNDANVMDAWAEATGGRGRILYLSDGNAEFALATGLDLDSTGVGRGLRMKRFSMIVEDGVVTALNVEDTTAEAEKSGAARILEQL
ncbi:peroxiredoxin [Propylenella binzhouense]|uniref:Glutathione-dependent peroxiredoxin n=1 Tax=Propylenella binzhouense TaxID=2555902 RepID=A0A964T4W2_9HYPH|nr:peroxiredoxin [Propylenella binzhouense]MYZ48556.1 peroxiredoxin [Propylenella binzhouense]